MSITIVDAEIVAVSNQDVINECLIFSALSSLNDAVQVNSQPTTDHYNCSLAIIVDGKTQRYAMEAQISMTGLSIFVLTGDLDKVAGPNGNEGYGFIYAIIDENGFYFLQKQAVYMTDADGNYPECHAPDTFAMISEVL